MIETKVTAATSAAAAASLLMWVLQTYAFNGGAVPAVLQSWIYTLVPAAITFAAGYLAKHTPQAQATVIALPPATPAQEVPPAPKAGM